MRLPTLSVVFISLPLLVVGSAAAQGGPSTLEFSFSNPGARSMGLGGAFAAIADDATAAFANPAGLVQLLRPEISVEGRHWSYSTPFTQGGRLTGDPTGIGLDNSAGLRTAESTEDLTGLSFLSYVYPGRNWSIALYRHQLANFRFRSETQGLFFEGPRSTGRILDIKSTLDIDIVSYAVSGAYRVTEALSVGLGLTYFDGSFRWTGGQFFVDEPTFDALFGPNSYLDERMLARSALAIDDTGWGFNLGLLWNVSPRWRIGGVYRRGPEFSYSGESRAGPAHEEPEGTVLEGGYDLPISFPDVYGLGVSYRTTSGGLTVGFELDRVEYSTIIESITSNLVETHNVVMEDGFEVHLGAEVVLLGSAPLIALRAGCWLDPNHRIRNVGPELLDRALFPPGNDSVHWAFGLGVVSGSFQIDLGVDLSDFVDTASLSVIYSF